MARVRAMSWGTTEYWISRITRYIDCDDWPREARAPRVAYVAVGGDTVVGLIAGHETRRHDCDGELQWVDVVPEYRGTGVAAALICELARWFDRRALHRVCVNVEPTNTLAHRFFTRLGARPLASHWLVWDDIAMCCEPAPDHRAES